MDKIIEDYLDNAYYRQQFNELAKQTFNLDFEDWYQKGYLKDNYRSYAVLKDDVLVANISINKFHLVINHEVKKAIQIGTVMTDKRYRQQGLSKRLMEHILKQYPKEEYIVYLFANETVLDFYPKLGFERVLEKHYEMDAKQIVKKETPIRVLAYNELLDYEIIASFVKSRKPVSGVLGIINDSWPLLAYCDDTGTGALHYLKEDQVIVKASRKDKVLHLYDILSLKHFELHSILEKMISEEDECVIVHFIPDEKKYKWQVTTVENDKDALFIRKGQVFSNEILFPLTSHT